MTDTTLDPGKNHGAGAELPGVVTPAFSVESAVVTGGTRGIGRELVSLLGARLGASVVTCGRSEDAVQSIQASSANIAAVTVDLTQGRELFSRGEVDRNPILMFGNNAGYEFGRDAAARLGGIKLLILNAGVSGLEPAENLRATEGVQSLANKWMTSVVGTYLACEEALVKSGGTAVFISTPLVHQRQHMTSGLPPELEPYLRMKESIVNQLWRVYTRAGGPLSAGNPPALNLMILEPGSVDTQMHEQTLRSGPALAERTLRLKEEGRLRDPAIVARIILRMGAANAVFNHETLNPGVGKWAPAYISARGPQKWTHDVSDEAYRFEHENLHRPPLDSWWFEPRG